MASGSAAVVALSCVVGGLAALVAALALGLGAPRRRSLRGARCVVTGGSSGIGLAAAERLAAQGAKAVRAASHACCAADLPAQTSWVWKPGAPRRARVGHCSGYQPPQAYTTCAAAGGSPRSGLQRSATRLQTD